MVKEIDPLPGSAHIADESPSPTRRARGVGILSIATFSHSISFTNGTSPLGSEKDVYHNESRGRRTAFFRGSAAPHDIDNVFRSTAMHNGNACRFRLRDGFVWRTPTLWKMTLASGNTQ